MKTNAQNFFGRYEVLRKIAEGASGEIYYIRDPQWDRYLALKILNPKYLTDVSAIKRFERESQALCQLNHPNIMRFYEAGKLKGYYYYIMDYIDGESLEDIIAAKKLSSSEYIDIIIQIADVLDYVHKQNIVHRDIKPDNIIIGKGNRVYLTDFGLARAIDGRNMVSRDGDVIGTPMYMSPEQIKNTDVDGRSDIYSLGAVLYRLMTGEYVFAKQSTFTLLMDITEKSPKPPRSIDAEIPVALEKICLKCLKKDKEDRYQTAKELSDALQNLFAAKKSQKIAMLVIAIVIVINLIIWLLFLYTNSVETNEKSLQQKLREMEEKNETLQRINYLHLNRETICEKIIAILCIDELDKQNLLEITRELKVLSVTKQDQDQIHYIHGMVYLYYFKLTANADYLERSFVACRKAIEKNKYNVKAIHLYSELFNLYFLQTFDQSPQRSHEYYAPFFNELLQQDLSQEKNQFYRYLIQAFRYAMQGENKQHIYFIKKAFDHSPQQYKKIMSLSIATAHMYDGKSLYNLLQKSNQQMASGILFDLIALYENFLQQTKKASPEIEKNIQKWYNKMLDNKTIFYQKYIKHRIEKCEMTHKMLLQQK